MTMRAYQDEPLGMGHYSGEVRLGADGRLYEWVQGVDGLGNPIGFWKAVGDVVTRTGKAVGSAAGAAADVAQRAAGKVARVLDPVKRLFQLVVSTNVASAKRVAIPQHFRDKLRQYAGANASDGAILRRALARKPRFYRGGWIMKLQPGASAMTLGRHVFVQPGARITPRLYAHELVHVEQYGRLGVTGFLLSYFGMSALTVLRRMIQRKPLQVMKSSPHERQAYAIDQRFDTWCAANATQCRVGV